MGRARTLKTNFTAGEVSPALRGRVDIEKFFNGAEKLENFIVKPQGGAFRRSGTEFIAEIKDSSAKVRLIEFEFSEEQAYVLELGNQYLRVYRDGGIVVESDFTITSITAANPGVVTTSASHGYSNGDHVYIEGCTNMPELNGRRFTVANQTATTFELSGEDTSSLTAATDGTVKKVYEVATPWATADLDALYFTQSADVLYVVHGDYEPRKITRTAHTTWTVSTLDGSKGPYLPLNATDVTMRLSSISDTATAKASSSIFAAGDLNDFIEYTNGNGLWGLAEVSVDPSSSTDEATVIPKEVFEFTVDGSQNYLVLNSSDLESPYSGTFDQDDIGRFARATNFNWYEITSLKRTSNAQAGVGAAKTMVTGYTRATDRVKLEGRAITATLTASSATFASTDVGRWVRLNFGNKWVDCEITAYTSTTVVSVSVHEDTPVPKDRTGEFDYMNDGETVFWRLGAWSDTTGWPETASFHQQRLWFANTADSPDSFWASKIDDYDNFQPTDYDGTGH